MRPNTVVVRISVLASGLGVLYALYRGYYALGGTVGMFGVPVSHTTWLVLNGAAAVLTLTAAAVPIVGLPLWNRRWPRRALLVLCSVAAVGMVMHAAVDESQRLLGLAGLLHIDPLPASLWVSVDRRASDLQDVLFNEPWFLAEGLLCGALVWQALDRPRARRWWLAGALTAVTALTLTGMLSATGVIGRVIVF